MDILSMHNDHDRKKMLELCKNLLEKRSLIPVIGAGFSFGTPTDNNGAIQSVTDLQNLLLQYIEQYSGYDQAEIDEIKRQPLSEIASCFWVIFDPQIASASWTSAGRNAVIIATVLVGASDSTKIGAAAAGQAA